MRRRWGVPLLLALSGCDSPGSTLSPKGPSAAQIAELSWILFALGTALFLVVMLALSYSLFRARPTGAIEPPPPVRDDADRRLLLWAGMLLPALILLVVYALTIYYYRLALAPPAQPPTLVIEVVGYQWWWEIRYPEQGIVTANEIHIPVGQPVQINLLSEDVVHSFWLPRLAGKMDLVPGHLNTLTIEATEAGVYRGQCAEYCGLQHAKMAFLVIAEPAEEFALWLEGQQLPAAAPTSDLAWQGQEIFLTSSCADCHTIQGTAAQGEEGPDLTHLASRHTLGAASVPNNRGHLGGWVVDAQGIKPGNKMPPQPLSGEALQALLAYLESLD